MDTTLVKFEAARQALAEAKSIDEVKQIRDKAEALRLYVKQQGESLTMQNDIAEIKLRAERRAGELIIEMRENGELATQSDNQNTLRSLSLNGSPKRTLRDVGINSSQNTNWTTIAALPEATFEKTIIETKAKGGELTSAGMLRVAKEAKQSANRDLTVRYAQTLPDTVFNVIYADPPWQYNNTGVHGAAQHHYTDLPLPDICAFPETIGLQIAPHAVLFLWVTNPFLQDAFSVVEAWGFEYKTNIVWTKTDLVKPGSGFYVRGRHELLFICTRGSFTPLDQHISPPIGSVLIAPVQDHSRKPDEVYSIIERLYPGCNYVELFARQNREGWTGYGNELD